MADPAEPVKNMNVADIIQQAFEKKPIGVEDAFNDVVQQKMADAIAIRRSQIEDEMAGRTPADDNEDFEDVDTETQDEDSYEDV